jgi:hypothetical protein
MSAHRLSGHGMSSAHIEARDTRPVVEMKRELDDRVVEVVALEREARDGDEMGWGSREGGGRGHSPPRSGSVRAALGRRVRSFVGLHGEVLYLGEL